MAREKTTKKKKQIFEVFARLRKNRFAFAGFITILLLFLLAIFAPLIAPYSYSAQDLTAAYQWPSATHLLGTDNLGRDILSRLIFGTRESLSLGVFSVAIGASIGIIVGAVAGFYGKMVDNVLMRFLDIYQSIPGLLLSIAFAAALGPGLNNAIIAIGVSTIAGYARLMRSSVMTINDKEYIEAARAINANDFQIIVKHILPNAIAPLIVEITMNIGFSILAGATLSFIGLGAQPPSAEWGAMLSAGRNYMRDYGYLVIFPGIFIMISVIAFNLLGDGLRDALDPHLKK